MKRLLIFSTLLTLVFFTSCRKDDNPRVPDLTKVKVPIIQLDPTSDQFINPVNPASFKARFTVELLFENEGAPKQVDVVVMKNDDKGNVKAFQSNITLPIDLEITGQKLIDLFGPIQGGDKFDIGTDITLDDGTKLLAFPPVGEAYASGMVTLIDNVKPGAVTSLQFLMPCPFDADAYNGNFIVVSDEWEDYAAGTVIPVTKVSATQISFKYNVDAGSAQPIILTIDPSNNSISVAKQYYGSYGGTPVHAQSVAGAASLVNPCDVSLSVRLKHTDPSGGTTYGTATIRLRKQ